MKEANAAVHGATAPTRDAILLEVVAAAVQQAGAAMLAHFDAKVRTPLTLEQVVRVIHDNDRRSLEVLRGRLEQARPEAGWVEDELDGGALPAGEWWVVDPMEGNINHVHGIGPWGVSATLIRDNLPVLTAIHEPSTQSLYTAIRGSGAACMNGVPMQVSGKVALNAAIVTTGQARPGESALTHRRIGDSVRAMLGAALVVRMTVPATFELASVAGGRIDGFWQHSNVRSGLAAGALLVSEAGGTVTDLRGEPWTLASDDFLAAAPGVHRACVDVLGQIA